MGFWQEPLHQLLESGQERPLFPDISPQTPMAFSERTTAWSEPNRLYIRCPVEHFYRRRFVFDLGSPCQGGF